MYDAAGLTGIDGRPSFCFGSDEPVDPGFVSFVLGFYLHSPRFKPFPIFLKLSRQIIIIDKMDIIIDKTDIIDILISIIARFIAKANANVTNIAHVINTAIVSGIVRLSQTLNQSLAAFCAASIFALFFDDPSPW